MLQQPIELSRTQAKMASPQNHAVTQENPFSQIFTYDALAHAISGTVGGFTAMVLIVNSRKLIFIRQHFILLISSER